MKSLILGFFLRLSVSMGNLFTAGVNHFVSKTNFPASSQMLRGVYPLIA